MGIGTERDSEEYGGEVENGGDGFGKKGMRGRRDGFKGGKVLVAESFTSLERSW